MKTRNYTPAKLVSHCTHTGTAPYARMGHYGAVAAKQAENTAKQGYVGRKSNRIEQRKAERTRQKTEQGLNWNLIRLLLDANKGLSLADAKAIAQGLGSI